MKNEGSDIARNCKEESKRAFDAQAATYDGCARGEHARRLYPFVLEEIVAAMPSRALDLGCGTGALAQLVLAAVPGCTLSGVDLSEAMLACAQEQLGQRVQLYCADSEHLPFSDETFDLVYCNDSFHHYPNPRRAAFEAWRVLRPGGTFVAGECWLPAPARQVMNAFVPYGGSGDVRIYSEAELCDILGMWFGKVTWKKAGSNGCVVWAAK